MTTNEAAAIAGRTPTTIRNWIKRKVLAASIKQTVGPPGFRLDITEEALAAAIAAQRRPGRPYKHPQTQTPEAQTVEESKPC
jgi:hypothetical protein